jgi:hemin uptake protein HemP
LDHVHDTQITKPARIISTRRTDLLSSHKGESYRLKQKRKAGVIAEANPE